jgi:hypothetical protein
VHEPHGGDGGFRQHHPASSTSCGE